MHLTDVFQTPELFPYRGRGVVARTISPADRGRVRFQASYWPARLFNGSWCQPLAPGEPVEVVGREGITLLIKPLGRSQETG